VKINPNSHNKIMETPNPSQKLAALMRASCFIALFLLAGLLVTTTTAQTFSLLKGFDATGDIPQAPLFQGPDNTLYGTTTSGGTNGAGVVFKIQPDGSGYTVLWNFSGGSDGGNPYAGLVLSGNTLYGTAYYGGSSGLGTVFAINTDGSGFTNLYSFTGGLDCGNPYAGLILAGSTLYGTTTGESSSIAYYGSVFKISTNGSGFTVLKTFKGGDGANPYGGLVLSGNGLYGTTASGTPGYGTVFKVSIIGTGFTTLYSFSGGSDGGSPYGRLLLSGSTLYGTTYSGGNYSEGTVFEISTSGGGFTTLHNFTGGNDGGNPYGGLLQSGNINFLYGTTTYGGSNYSGTMFEMTTAGGFKNLYNFTGGNDGAYPQAGLILSANTLYGTAASGGNSGGGTLFGLTLFGPPIITNQPISQIVPAGSIVTFGVGVIGTAPLAYQWASNNVALPGATNATLTVTNVSLADSGSAYSVLVTNIYFNTQLQIFTNGSVLSSSAMLTVVPVLVTNQPADQIVLAGNDVTFSVGAVGAAPLAFQWSFNDIALPGATNATLALDNASPPDSGNYSVLITNSLGSVVSSNAELTVLTAIVMTQPASSLTATGAVLNGLAAAGTETVVWFEWGTDTNYGNIAGITTVPDDNSTNNLSTALGGLNGGIYHYRIDAANDFGIVYGNDQSFAVGFAPTATTLAAVASTNGSTLNGTINPNGLDTSVYFKWGVVNGPLSNSTPVMDVGAGATPLNVSSFITSVAPATRYIYQVVASNYLGTVFGAVVTFYSHPFVSVPNENWDSVASSANGSVLVAVANMANGASPAGPIIISTNSGATWAIATGAPTNGFWETVACSADGSEMIAAGGGGDSILGPIYTSADMGVTWVSNNAPVINWQSVASSADGTRLVAIAELNRVIYTSTNSGAVWTLATNAPKASWFSVALSADGTKLAAVANGSVNIFTSPDFGTTWITNNVPAGPQGIQHFWSSIASSADGSKLVAAGCHYGNPGFIFISTNSGAAWKLTATNTVSGLVAHPWIGVASSADGSKLAAVSDIASPLGVVITSANSGATWTTNAVPFLDWNAVALSADGAKLVASVGYPSIGPIYISQTTPAPVMNLSASDNVISWIIPSLDFTLQESPDLLNWTDVTNPPVLNLTNLQNQVTLPSPDGNSFFRLMH
jgi:uncharacterized repeat protein (TIGR03803 family)